MTENQNDQHNQQPDNKSHLQKTQDGKKTEETNPNNPKAGQSSPYTTEQSNRQNQGSNANQGKTSTDVEDAEISKDETIDVPTSAGRTSNDEKDSEGRKGDQNSKNGNL